MRFYLCILALMLSACSAKVTSDGGDGGAPVATPFNDLVTGPVLDGTWQGTCAPNHFFGSANYVIYTMIIKGSKLTRTDEFFTDANCTQVSETIVRKGQFRYTKQLTAGSQFEVEYRMSPSRLSGRTENILVEPNTLWVSGYVSGSAYPDIGLRKQ